MDAVKVLQTRQVVALLVIVAIISFVLGTALGYNVSSEKTTTLTTSQTETIAYTVVQNNITVHGEAAGIPCAALQLPCTSTNLTIVANLIHYQGSYYYDSNFTLNNVVYMIWYNNSTYYRVSPTPPTNEHANHCPPE